MNKKLFAALLIFCLALPAFAGCSDREEVIADTDTIYITTTGATMTVQDRTAGKKYIYHSCRTPRENKPTEPRTEADTETIKIVLLPDGRTEITDKAGKTVYTIRRHPQRKE